MSELAKWINELAGDYVEDWVGHQIAEGWQKDRDKITELEAELAALREAVLAAMRCYAVDGYVNWERVAALLGDKE